MKSAVFCLITSAFLVSAASITAPAHAQSLDGQTRGSYEVAQAYYDIYVDERGRRFLVHPETGRIIGRANRNARFSRRDQALAQREFDRVRRRSRFQDRLEGLFASPPERPNNGQRTNQGGITVLKRQPTPPPAKFPPADIPQDNVARLPDYQEPAQNTVQFRAMPKPKYNKVQMASLQVFLDREGFSPGVIDGRWGSNVAKAVASWKEASGSKANLGNADILAQYMQQTGGDALAPYTIVEADIAGPFIPSVPVDYARKAELEELSYTSIYEKLAEKFHMSEAYLRQLNPGKDFYKSGTVITVVAPGTKVTEKVHYIIADKNRKQVRAYNRNGRLVTAYPATIGSSSTPSPVGTHAIDRIAFNPEYTYNPKKNFQQGENNKVLRIPPGPNGPVGAVWIALSKPTYGIHGTPNPDTIGKTNSHGCIRLTNWDAQELAKLVRKGVTVEFVE